MVLKKILVTVMVLICAITSAQSAFVHPGMSHKLSDLDRMKYMVEAGIEPYATSFQNLSSNSRAQHTYTVNVVNQDPSYITEYSSNSKNWFKNDGTAAYYNALMWYITGDSRHADKAIEILNIWNGLVRNTSGIPLESGRVWRVIEAAEIIAHTYNKVQYPTSGWSETDIQKFKDMLVYPGYQNTVPTAAIASNDITFYWKIYNGDVVRHGNQGLFAMRTMMAIAIFTDNETMYQRVINYLEGLAPPTGDVPYPTGPLTRGTEITTCDYFDEYTGNTFGTTPNYHGNEAIANYIYDNGQGQESSRDQAHAVAGVSTIAIIAEMAWNQGYDLYGFLDNRPLLGLEFYYHYNLSYAVQGVYSDQMTPWEPTVASGEYKIRTDRSGRWTSQQINPFVNCDETNLTRGEQLLEPIHEMNLGHYRDRMNLPSDDYKWLERGHEYLTGQISVEGEGTVTDHPGYGGLKFRRVTPGDPISGFDLNGLPDYNMNELPITIEAENYDYFVLDGEGRTYSDTNSTNSGGEYRTDEGVDIEVCSEGGYNITSIENGEWLTYTVNVPSNGIYDIDIRYASANANGNIKFNIGGTDVTTDVVVPFGSPNSTGLTDWQDFNVISDVRLSKGVQALKILFNGINDAFKLNNFRVSLIQADLEPINLTGAYGTATQSSDRPSDGFAPNAIDGNTNGVYNNGSVSHTSANATLDPEPWWQVDLGSNYDIKTIDVYNRTDGCCSGRLNNFTVQVLDAGGMETFSQFYATAPSNSFTVVTEGVMGSVVRISKTSSTALTLAEVEVYGIDNGILSNETFDLQKHVQVYPNPVTDVFTITNSQGAAIEVYNIVGELIMKTNIKSNKQPVDISSFKIGMYFVRINNNGVISNKKVIKK